MVIIADNASRFTLLPHLICVENGMKNEENALTSKLRTRWLVEFSEQLLNWKAGSIILSCDTKNRHPWFDGIAHCLLYRGMRIRHSKSYGMPL